MNNFSKSNRNCFRRFSKFMIFFTSIYITLFSVCLELDSEFGLFIKSVSNIGVERRIWFFFWCLFVSITLFCNFLVLQQKYHCKLKVLKILNFAQVVSLMLAWLVPNNADKKINFLGMITAESDLFLNKISERSFHQAMSSVFGLSVIISLIIFALWAYKNKKTKENLFFLAGLFVYLVLTATTLSYTVTGLTEWIAVLIAFAVLYYYNYSFIFEKTFIKSY